MASQGVLKLCADQTVTSLAANAPVETGRLVAALTEVEGPHHNVDGGWVGIGDLDKLGHPDQKPERGLIGKFLKWYRRGEARRRPSPGLKGPFDPRWPSW